MFKYTRLPNETDEELLYRLGNIREQEGWTWYDLRDIMNDITGQGYTESKWRKQYQAFIKMFNANQTQLGDEKYLDEIAIQKFELQKAKYKFFDERNALNKMLRDRARQEELNEIITDAVNKGNLPEFKNRKNYQCVHENNDMFVSLNDIHYGATISNAWNEYNSDIAFDRMEKYAFDIVELQGKTKSQNCIVWCNGDEISGAIHKTIQITNKENVIEQITGVSELISRFLVTLAGSFEKVIFCSVAGNHSRLDSKKDALKGERADDLIEWYLRARLQTFDNIDFDSCVKIDDTFYKINARGKTFIGCHGDYDNNMNKILVLEKMLNEPVYGILTAHLHHNKFDNNQGIYLFMGGSFQGMDDYCVEKRILGKAEQLAFTLTENGISGIYPIVLQN